MKSAHDKRGHVLWTTGLVSAALAITLAVSSFGGCSANEEPEHLEIMKLSGTPYDRGYAHGKRFSSKIRSFYNQMLSNSILPFLNREQRDIVDVLPNYGKPPYTDGTFSYLMMLESANHLKPYIPKAYLDEIQGISDGSGMPYDEILVLNTFLDTMLAFRAITFFIKRVQAPYVVSVSVSGIDDDEKDNDGDDAVDEAGEDMVKNYNSIPHALYAEVPLDAVFTFVLKDQKFDVASIAGDDSDDFVARNVDPERVNPDSIRIQLDDIVYESGHDSIVITDVEEDETALRVTFTPPGGLPPAAVVSLILQAGDMCDIIDPPPQHARYMRDERLTVTTAGYGKPPHQVPNKSADDGRSQPPSISFALRGSATADGSTIMGHHYALLDANTSHKHPVLFEVTPPEDEGIPHVYLGWTGIVYGFTGMNAAGLSYSVNNSDTLSNPLVNEFMNKFLDYLLYGSPDVQLLSSGVPMGIMGRELLTHSRTVEEGAAYLESIDHTYGWNIMLADAAGGIRAVSVRSRIDELERDRYTNTMITTPLDRDMWGNRLHSVDDDDLYMASHYQAFTNGDGYTEDIHERFLVFDVVPQRIWTSFYFRSLRAFYVLRDEIIDNYGVFDVPLAIGVLRNDALVDTRDSMSAVVYQPQQLKLHFAMGEMPATDGPFIEYDLSHLTEGISP